MNRLIFVLLFLILAGCGEVEVEQRAVQDGAGRDVALPDTVERLITLSPNLTEIAYVAGAGGRIVAVTTADDYPSAITSLPRFSALPVDFEAILQFQPDLVLSTADVNSIRDMAAIEAFGTPVYAFSFSSIEDVFDAIVTVGGFLGTQTEARQAVDALRARVQKVMETSRNASPRVLILIGIETLYSFGSGSYVNEMIAAAGGESVTDKMPSAAPVLSDEFVLETDPDVIIVATNREVGADDILGIRPAWRSMRAIEDGHVYAIDPDLVLRAGPRIVDGIEAMNAIFSEVDESSGR